MQRRKARQKFVYYFNSALAAIFLYLVEYLNSIPSYYEDSNDKNSVRDDISVLYNKYKNLMKLMFIFQSIINIIVN